MERDPKLSNLSLGLNRRQLLRDFAKRYIWWKTPEESLRHPLRIAAQVMNVGDFEDSKRLAEEFGFEFCRKVLASAEIVQFNGRSWHYWHYRLGMADLGSVPAMPERKLG